MGWTVLGSNPIWSETFRTSPDRPWGPPSLLYNVNPIFRGIKRPGRGADHPPHLSPRLKKEYSYNSTPLWAFVTCSRVKFTCTYKYIHIMLGQIAGLSAPHQIKEESSYQKCQQTVCDVQPPRTSDLNPVDFALWGQLKLQCIQLCLKGRDSLSAYFLCRSNHSQTPRGP